jgi:hypothetical protein
VDIVNGDLDLLTSCVEGLRRHVGKPIETVQPTNGGDALLRIQTDPPLTLLVQLSRHRHPTGEQIRNDALRARERLGKSKNQQVILLAPWIPDQWGDFLREQGVAYADSLGNAWIATQSPALLVHVRGNKPERRIGANTGRLIEPSGLKILQLLLSAPESLKLTSRTFATLAGVSPASASIVLRYLAGVGAIQYRRTAPRRPAHLGETYLDIFIHGYALKLRPQLLIGRFRHRTSDPEVILRSIRQKLGPTRARWALTGGVAAGLMTRHLKTDQLALFVDEAGEKIVRREPILSDPREGNLTLFRHYAPSVSAPSPVDNYPTATPLLVYAELLHDGRPRELETAALLRNQVMPVKTDGV